ncbi:MAG TPA: hypothetical protein VFQ79_02740 [Bryobacteraceae bacterium]|nr:hypothetical protein [Bryobacteraceae bacterium]
MKVKRPPVEVLTGTGASSATQRAAAPEPDIVFDQNTVVNHGLYFLLQVEDGSPSRIELDRTPADM